MAKRLVKYMGSSDIRTLERSEDFDGQLRDGIGKRLVFDASNKWVVDVGDLGTDAVDLLLAVNDGKEFVEVTDSKRVPSNLHQQIFHAHKANAEPAAALPDDLQDDADTDPAKATGTVKKK